MAMCSSRSSSAIQQQAHRPSQWSTLNWPIQRATPPPASPAALLVRRRPLPEGPRSAALCPPPPPPLARRRRRGPPLRQSLPPVASLPSPVLLTCLLPANPPLRTLPARMLRRPLTRVELASEDKAEARPAAPRARVRGPQPPRPLGPSAAPAHAPARLRSRPSSWPRRALWRRRLRGRLPRAARRSSRCVGAERAPPRFYSPAAAAARPRRPSPAPRPGSAWAAADRPRPRAPPWAARRTGRRPQPPPPPLPAQSRAPLRAAV